MNPYSYYVYGDPNTAMFLYYRYDFYRNVYEFWHPSRQEWVRSLKQSDLYLTRILDSDMPEEALT